MKFYGFMKNLSFLCFGAALLTACASRPEPKNYSVFRDEDPHSILVVPALNNTQSVEAAEFFVSTVSRPFAERGYYTFPAHMVRRIMGENGLDDPSLVHTADPRRLAQIFGCDSALFITIDRWDSQYILISTTTTVAFTYTLRSCRTGAELWTDNQSLKYSPSASGSGNVFADLIAQAVVSAIEKGSPNYIPLTQQANGLAAATPSRGLPAGPYRVEEYLHDQQVFPSTP